MTRQRYGRPEGGDPTEQSEKERGFFDGLLAKTPQPLFYLDPVLTPAYDLGYQKGLAQAGHRTNRRPDETA
jgi:hypothetical protein